MNMIGRSDAFDAQPFAVAMCLDAYPSSDHGTKKPGRGRPGFSGTANVFAVDG